LTRAYETGPDCSFKRSPDPASCGILGGKALPIKSTFEDRLLLLAVQAGTINPCTAKISHGQTKPLVSGVAFLLFFLKKG